MSPDGGRTCRRRGTRASDTPAAPRGSAASTQEPDPIGLGPAAHLDRLPGERRRNPAEARLDPAPRGVAGDDGKGTDLPRRQAAVGADEQRAAELGLGLSLAEKVVLAAEDRQRHRVVEALEMPARAVEGRQRPPEPLGRRRPDGSVQVGRAAARKRERAIVGEDRPAVVREQVPDERPRRLDLRHAPQAREEPRVQAANLRRTERGAPRGSYADGGRWRMGLEPTTTWTTTRGSTN
jgi:hypothetical protein